MLFVAPLVTFFVYSFLTAGLFAVSGPATLENYEDVVTSSVNGTLALNSFYVGLCTAAVTVLVALPIAYWLRYCAGRSQTTVLFLITATLFASYLVRIYAWRTILGENGLLNSGLRELGLIDGSLGFLLFNRFAVTVALVHIFLPYVVLVLYAGFRPISPALLESAQDLGGGVVTRWRKVVLPLIAAPAVTSFLFVFVLSASDYVTPQFLGGTSGAMLGRRIQEALTGLGNFPLGAAMSFLMLAAFVLCFLLASAGLRILKLDRIRFVEVAPAPATQRSPFAATVLALALVFLFVPLVVVVLFSFHETGALSFPFEGFSLRWYRDVFSSFEFREALKNSAIVATVAAAVTLLLATAAAYGLSRMRPAAARPDVAALLPAAHASRAVPRNLDAGLLRPHRPQALARDRGARASRLRLPVLPPHRRGGARPARPCARGVGGRPRRLAVGRVPAGDAAADLAAPRRCDRARLRSLVRRVHHHVLRDRVRLDAPHVHLVEPAPDRRPVDQYDLHPAHGDHVAALGRCVPLRGPRPRGRRRRATASRLLGEA